LGGVNKAAINKKTEEERDGHENLSFKKEGSGKKKLTISQQSNPHKGGGAAQKKGTF